MEKRENRGASERDEAAAWRAFAETAEELVALIDADGQVLYVNRSPDERSVDEVVGQGAERFVVPERRWVLRAGMDSVFRDHLSFEYTTSDTTSDTTSTGTTERLGSGDFDVRGSPVWRDGEVVAALVVVRDVTRERSQARELESAREWRRVLFDGSRHAIFMTDAEARFIAVSQAGCELTGYTREELLTRRVPDLQGKLDVASFKSNYTQIWGGEERTSETVLVRKDGSQVEVEFSSRLVEIAGRSYVHTVARDITVRREIYRELQQSEWRLREAQRIAGVAEWELDIATNQVLWSHDVRRILGVEADVPASRQTFLDRVHPEDRERADAALTQLIRSGSPLDVEYRVIHPSGAERILHSRAGVEGDAAGGPVRVVGIIQDVTARRRAEEVERRARDRQELLWKVLVALTANIELDELLERLLLYLDSVIPYERAAVFILEDGAPEGELRGTFSRSAGASEDGLLRMASARGFPDLDQHKGRVFPLSSERVRRALSIGEAVVLEDVRERAPFEPAPEADARCRIAVPLVYADDVIGLLTVDRRERSAFGDDDTLLASTFARHATIAIHNARLYERASRLAVTDPLTGLANRRRFFQALEAEVGRSRRYERPLAIIMLDIDRFKHINDRFGHVMGDEVLVAVAERCRVLVRDSDIVARYGGEEFVVLLAETEIEGARAVGERLCEEIARLAIPAPENGHTVSVTVSVGVAALDESGISGEDVVQRADEALYRAKQEGRDRVIAWATDTSVIA